MHMTRFIHFLNEKDKPNLNFLQRPVFPEIYFFDLDGLEKNRGGGIVVMVSFPGHADPEAMLQQHLY